MPDHKNQNVWNSMEHGFLSQRKQSILNGTCPYATDRENIIRQRSVASIQSQDNLSKNHPNENREKIEFRRSWERKNPNIIRKEIDLANW